MHSTENRHRLIFASVNAGGGHRALRDSLIRSLEIGDPKQARYRPEVLDSNNTSIERTYRTQMKFGWLGTGGGWLLSDLRPFARAISMVYPGMAREADALFQEAAPPSLVISTHFAQTIAFAAAKRRAQKNVVVVGAIPDYTVPTHCFFPTQANLRADYLLVVDDKPYEHYLSQGVSPNRVHLSGFLPHPAFTAAQALDRDACFDRLMSQCPEARQLRSDLPTVIFMGGSAWTRRTAPVLKLLAEDEALLKRVNVVVVAGKDERFRSIAAAYLSKAPSAAVFGFVKPDLFALLLGVADIPVLGSIAPATLHELLEMRCGPILIFSFIPGAEDEHIRFVEKNDLGLYEPDPSLMLVRIAEACDLKPRTERIDSLMHSFEGRALALREKHRQRAAGLSAFLGGILGSEPAFSVADALGAQQTG